VKKDNPVERGNAQDSSKKIFYRIEKRGRNTRPSGIIAVGLAL
jgi:hypothetical protein